MPIFDAQLKNPYVSWLNPLCFSPLKTMILFPFAAHPNPFAKRARLSATRYVHCPAKAWWPCPSRSISYPRCRHLWLDSGWVVPFYPLALQKRWWFNGDLPFGKRFYITMETQHFWINQLCHTMAILNSKLLVYQRVLPVQSQCLIFR